jgi:hypothetical protein
MTEQRKDADIGFAGKKGGESEGGAYANPHSGKEKGGSGGFMGHGGQSEQAYHGTGQLGAQRVGTNPNSPAKSDTDAQDDQRGD